MRGSTLSHRRNSTPACQANSSVGPSRVGLRVRLLSEQAACPCCGSCLDAYMDHALVCSCGGDRTLRHNAIRNSFFRSALDSGVCAEKEKQGLLPPRPEDESLRGERGPGGRRPADVWLRAGPDGGPCAIDFAVTSGLRSDNLRTSFEEPSAIFGQYEEFKRQHADTLAQCQAQCLSFMPFVVEADGGGLGAAARRICGFVAKSGAARDGEDVEVQAVSLLRCISISLQRENARAVFGRLPTAPAQSQPGANPDAWSFDSAEWQ